MVRRVFSVFVCIMLLASATFALAGGPPVAAAPMPPCGPAKGYAPAGNPCAYWGDAPFPGLCGGVVALPFLVVGSLLGGNTVGPYPPVPGPAYRGYAPGVAYAPGRPGCPPPACGPGYGGAGFASNGILGGLPCLDLCANLLGGMGGSGLFQ
jgi:hypothetical protein